MNIIFKNQTASYEIRLSEFYKKVDGRPGVRSRSRRFQGAPGELDVNWKLMSIAGVPVDDDNQAEDD